jgi:hypothetical protein
MVKIDFIKIQNDAYTAIANELNKLNSFAGKIVCLSYCDTLIIKDLSDLYRKRHFNFDVGYMHYPIEGEIPLTFALYVDRLPIGYVIGTIAQERDALEIHFTESSNFYHGTGLKAWLPYMLTILACMKDVLNKKANCTIKSIAMINPVTDTIEVYKRMGFDFIENYYKANDALIISLE